MSRAHYIAVPSDIYCPDVRSLFVSPALSLELLQKMEDSAWSALSSGPLADTEWRRKTFSNDGFNLSFHDLQNHVMSYFSFPPSHQQIHLHYLMLPLLPRQLASY